MTTTRQAAKKRDSSTAAAPKAKRLSANMEDYLEAIYRLSDEAGATRVSKIAEAVGVKRPSVSKALKRLQRQGLVTHTPYGGAAVTKRGMEVAMAQVRSHRAITRFLEEILALRPEQAEHDACLMEHAISHETVERLVSFIDHLDRNGADVIAAYHADLKRATAREVAAKKSATKSGQARSWTSRV